MTKQVKPREIGGYLELEHFGGSEYHTEALTLNCARNCLVYLIEARHIERIWIPVYLCPSVKVAAVKAGTTVIDYGIGENFLPCYESMDIAKDDYLYLVDYYGQVSDAAILQAAERFDGRIIVDEVQNFYRMPVEHFDTLYCCRKFFGVPDGAYLYTEAKLERKLEQDESRERMAHLLGRLEVDAGSYYADFNANDKAFAKEPVKRMSKLTHALLSNIPYEQVAATRTDNFGYLEGRLGKLNGLDVVAPRGAYMYPLLLDNGAPIRRAMQEQKIFVPTLWPTLTDQTTTDGFYAQNILPLPVDQRYNTDDMAYMCDLLESLL